MNATKLPEKFYLCYSYCPSQEGIGRTESLQVKEGKLVWVTVDDDTEDKIVEVDHGRMAQGILRDTRELLGKKEETIRSIERELEDLKRSKETLLQVTEDLKERFAIR